MFDIASLYFGCLRIMLRDSFCVGVVITFALATSSMFPAVASEPIHAELLLKGGTIVDGSGAEPYQGDVAVRGDKIVAVGEFEVADVARTIDCK